MKKIHVAILFGGPSSEHEISIKSAKNIFNLINKKKFKVLLIWITRKGLWYLDTSYRFLLDENNSNLCRILLLPGDKNPFLIKNKNVLKIDVIFPITHGSLGENGSLQGLIKMLNIPFVGCGVLNSSISMDKDMTKRLLKTANILTAPYICFKKTQFRLINFDNIIKKLGLPFFIKPSNQGSSIGVSKVNNFKEFLISIKKAFDLDDKILIEKEIVGKEIECGVLEHNKIKTSVCGEIITKKGFYSYYNKYICNLNSKIIIPAKININISNKIRFITLKIFKILNCTDMARVDFFLTKNNHIIFNEVNTLPGFTSTSMYPKLWEYSGVNNFKLINKLIIYALNIHNK